MPQSANPRLPPDALARLHFHGFNEESEESDGDLDRVWPTPSVSRPEPSTEVTTSVCSNCGERNAPGTIFCVNCHAFLTWDEVAGEDDDRGNATVIPSRTGAKAQQRPDEDDVGTAQRPAVRLQPEADMADGVDNGLQIRAEESAVTVPATGQPATLPVWVTNTSTIVDGYGVRAPGAPSWLVVESDPIHLLPSTEEALAVRLRVNSATLIPAQQIDVVLRVHSMTEAGVQQELPIQVTVPIVDVPMRKPDAEEARMEQVSVLRADYDQCRAELLVLATAGTNRITVVGGVVAIGVAILGLKLMPLWLSLIHI